MSLTLKNYKSFVSRRQVYRRIAREKQNILNSANKISSDQVNLYNNLEVRTINVDSDSIDTTENCVDIDSVNNRLAEEAENIFSEYSISVSDIRNNLTVNQNTENNGSPSLVERLRQWVITTSITHSHVTSLLHILSDYHPELPLDVRSLLKTSTKMLTKKLRTGDYCHFGILNGLKHFFQKQSHILSCRTLSLSFNVDGIPLFKSSNLQLWPILCQIKNFNSQPFVVGIFCGSSKPLPLEDFLEDFIVEFNSLYDGFTLYGFQCKLKIHSFLCDAPARAYLKRIKSHSGYSSCERCNVYGTYVEGRVVLDSLSSQERTDESFNLQIDEDHHVGVSPLINLPIGMVTSFAIDYMHNICLGIMRKLLNTWIGGSLRVRFSGQMVTSISNNLLSLKLHIPVEFNRKPRSLSELNRWKATEFRTFLLYVGPIVLKNIIPKTIYDNFLLLHTAITIMTSDVHLSKIGVDSCKELLKYFVIHCKDLYGLQFIVYNVHILLHLSTDVKKYGALDNFSCFIFENYLGILKRLVKSTVNPLKEIHNRVLEMNLISCDYSSQDHIKLQFKVEHSTGPLLPGMNQYCAQFKKLIIRDITLTSVSYSIGNCYCMIQKSVIQIHNIINHNNSFSIIGKQFNSYRSLYSYPIDSRLLNIFVVSNLDDNLQIWPGSDFLVKCVVVPYCNLNEKVSVPIVHSIES